MNTEMEGQCGDPFATTWRRLDGIDALRGLAILLVLLNHVNMRLFLSHIAYGTALPGLLFSTLVWNGPAGVQIFFAISGFLITVTSLRRWTELSRVSVIDFYRIRFARIVPLLLLLLVVLSILDLIHAHNYVISATTGGLPSALQAALTFRINVLEARKGYLPGSWDVLWSLSVEETFYLCFPVVCWALGRRQWLFVAALLTFVVLGPIARAAFDHGNEVWYEYSYLGGMDAIALGALTGLIFNFAGTARFPSRLAGLSGIVLIAFSLVFRHVPALVHTGLEMSILAIGTCLLMTASARSGWRSPVVLRPLLNLGRRSYEIYLTHMFVVFAIFDLFLKCGKPGYGILPLFLAVIVAAGALGSVTARVYSEPVNEMLRARWRRVRNSVAVERSAEVTVEG